MPHWHGSLHPHTVAGCTAVSGYSYQADYDQSGAALNTLSSATIAQLATACSALPNCVGFSSLGVLKVGSTKQTCAGSTKQRCACSMACSILLPHMQSSVSSPSSSSGTCLYSASACLPACLHVFCLAALTLLLLLRRLPTGLFWGPYWVQLHSAAGVAAASVSLSVQASSSNWRFCVCVTGQDSPGNSISCAAVEQLTLVQLALLCQGTNNCQGFSLQQTSYLEVRHSALPHLLQLLPQDAVSHTWLQRARSTAWCMLWGPSSASPGATCKRPARASTLQVQTH